jgi:hypothetical protein
MYMAVYRYVEFVIIVFILTRFHSYMRSLCVVDIELANISKEKVVDKKVWQDEEFTNYESATSAVFMQVEKLSNSLIGSQYCFSSRNIPRGESKVQSMYMDKLLK